MFPFNRLPSDGRGPWPSRVAGLILLLLLVQLGWMSGTLGARLLAPEVTIAPLYNGADGKSAANRAPPAISLAELNLFGGSDSTLEVPTAISQNAPDTRLRLLLSGVAVARRAEESSAIVAEGSGGEVQWYRVGDQLPGNAELVEVQQDRILLRRQGQIETLRFPEITADRNLMAVASAKSSRVPQSTEEFVVEAQSRLAQDPTGTLAAVGFRPRDDSGRSGYVYDGSNPMLSSMSLRAGDVVLAVNGQVLGDMEYDREMIQQWSQQQELQIEVERDNARFSVTVPVP